MSTKTAGLRLVRVSPGGQTLRDAIHRLVRRSHPLQVTSIDEPALRGLRALFPPEEAEPMGVELVPLGNLVGRVCRMARVQTYRAAQAGHVVAAIAEACRRLPAESPFAATASMPGVHRALAETLGTLRSYGFDAGRLDLIAEEAVPHLAAKLRSIGFLLRETGDSLRDLGREQVTSWLERTVATNPAECEDAGDVAVLVIGELEPSVAEWVTWLARTPARVTVIGEVHPQATMFRDLERSFPGVKTQEAIDVDSLAGRLFVRDAAPVERPGVGVVAAPDLLGECEWALRRCAEELEDDILAGRVAILARELADYAPVLQASARRLGVRLSISWRAPLLSNRLVAFFLELLTALGSTDVRSLIKPLRSPYSGLPAETQTAIEAVLRDLHRDREGAWGLLEEVAESLGDPVPWLAPVLEWRAEAIQRPAGAWEWFGRIMTLADLIPWQDAAIDFPQFIERDGRAQTAMQRAITERASLAKIRQAPSLEYRAAVAWMREAWESADYSVPSQEGGIRVVANAAELGDCTLVVALGMLEGILPRRPREDPILGDLEREALSRIAQLNIPLPTSKDEALREREEFVRLCGAARERLVLSYRLATGDRNNIPTAYIEEAERLSAQTKRTVYSRGQFTPDEPRLPGDVSLARAFETRQALAETDFLDEKIRARFLWEESRPFEPQQLRRAVQCPFRFFARDRLGLRPARRLYVWNRLLDLPVTAELALQPDRDAAEGALRGALDDLVDSQVGRLADWELAVIRSGGRRMIADWVEREFRARTLWPRHDMHANVSIGSPGVMNKAARDVTLTGTVPALGTMGSYALARLYETSAPDRLGRESNDAVFLYYALWSVVARGDADATAIEVETLGHERRLFVLPRLSGPLPSDPEHGLYAAAVTMVEEDAVKAVNARARGLVRLGADRARGGIVAPTPSPEHCPGCGYGELCRRSAEFGESDDPFEAGDG